jgi:hypothetical protein
MGGPKKTKKDGRFAFNVIYNFAFRAGNEIWLRLGYVELNKFE